MRSLELPERDEDECAAHDDLPFSRNKMLFFDPFFYEARAIHYLAKEHPVVYGVRIRRFSKPYREWPEVDGIQEIDGKEFAIEIKSFPLSVNKLHSIVKRYKQFGFERFKIIAPYFFKKVDYIANCEVNCIEYRPNLRVIEEYYKKLHHNYITKRLEVELNTGFHHFRYKLAFRSKRKPARFLNQVDKRIKSLQSLKKEILRRIPKWNPPIRVYWSTMRWLFPKQLYFAKDTNYLLGGPLVFDIDGSKIHGKLHPCYIDESGICNYCILYAKLHTMKLLDFLYKRNLTDVEIVFSGRQGFHIYVLDWKTSTNTNEEKVKRLKLLDEIKRNGIKVDERVTNDLKHVVTFPGSLHGYSMRRVTPIKNIDSFNISHIEVVGE